MAYSPVAITSPDRVRRVDAGTGVQTVRRAQQMGRHRRSAAAPAVQDHAAGDPGRHRGARHGKRTGTPVRTGLIGASAALAVGAVAVASGLLPGGDTYSVGGGPAADQVRTEGVPDRLGPDGSTTAPADRAGASAQASRGAGRADGPTKAESPSRSPSSAKPSRTSEPTGRTESSPSPTPPTSSKTAAPVTTEKSSAAPGPRLLRSGHPQVRGAGRRRLRPRPPCSPWSTRNARRSVAAP